MVVIRVRIVPLGADVPVQIPGVIRSGYGRVPEPR